MKNTPGIENCVVSTHCHNDLGLATANTLAGVMAGARQVEVAMNGIGERAGNTSLEEVVMALHTRRPFFNLSTGIDTTHIMRVSKMVSNYTGIIVQPNKAIVGANAFAHEAGIHQDGMLKNQQTYEIMRPESVGVKQSQLVLGKHSGRHALKIHLEALGYPLEDSKLDKLFEDFKVLADKKKIITNADLEALVAEELYKQQEVYLLDGMQITCGTMGMPTASVRLIGPDGKKHVQSSIGTGPVDALYKAIDGIIHVPNKLTEFSIHAVTEGIDAIGEVTVRIQNGEGTPVMHAMKDIKTPRSFGGYGADTDILVACAKAYLAAINKMLVATGEYDSLHTDTNQLN
jgi:2-isopropylmalate synthase